MTTVIYHSADFDGLFCREIAKKFLGEKDAQYIGWNFSDPPIKPNGSQTIYIMDLPVDRTLGLTGPYWASFLNEHGLELVWIDHHKTSIDTHPTDIPGYRIDGVAACRLAWQWFYCSCQKIDSLCPALPTKEDFIDRKVSEPLAVRLAGEHDVWDHRDPRAETFQYGLRADSEPGLVIQRLLNDDPLVTVAVVLAMGYPAQLYAQNVDASICNSLTWIMEWEGLKFLTVNHARFNSQLFAAKDKPETGHDALLGFRFDGKKWMVSLYHAAHRKDLDLSVIAQKHGGGGHRGACGFVCDKLPFSL